MSTSPNLLDALASPTPVSESEFPPEPDKAYTVRTSAGTIAPDPVFHQQDTTKEFTTTAGNDLVVEDVHLSLPIPQSSQESNPQGNKARHYFLLHYIASCMGLLLKTLYKPLLN